MIDISYIIEGVEGIIPELVGVEVMDDVALAETLNEQVRGILIEIEELRELRQILLPIIRKVVVLSLLAMTLIIFLLAYRPQVGLIIVGAIGVVVGGLQLSGDMFDITSSLIQNLSAGLSGEDAELLEAVNSEGLNAIITRITRVNMTIHGVILLVGIMLIVVGILLWRKSKLISPQNSTLFF